MKIRIAIICAVLCFAGLGIAEIYTNDVFDYAVGTVVADSSAWVRNSCDNGVSNGNLTVSGLAESTGNKCHLYQDVGANIFYYNTITYLSAGLTSGQGIYVSLILQIEDVGTLATNNTRFLCAYRQNFFNGVAVRRHIDDVNTFDIAIANNADDTPLGLVWDDNGGVGYTEGVNYFIVFGSADAVTEGSTDLKLWINPDSSTFGDVAPAASKETNPRNSTGTSGSVLYVGTGNGAKTWIDELRIGRTYADVTPSGIIRGTTIEIH